MEKIKEYLKKQAYETGLLAQKVGDQATHWLLTLNSGGTAAILAALFVTKDVPEAYWLKTILISFLIGTVASLSSIILRYSILNGMTNVWSRAYDALNTDLLDPSTASPDPYFREYDSFLDKVKYIYVLCIISFGAICFSFIYGIYHILTQSF